MSDKLLNFRDIQFVLYEQLKVEKLLETERYSMHSREGFDMVLDAAYKLAREMYWPAYVEMDRDHAHYDAAQKKAFVPKVMHKIFAAAVEGGWTGLNGDEKFGGQQFPNTVSRACDLIFNAANTTAAMYTAAPRGGIEVLEQFHDEKLTPYIKKLVDGEWGATMCLTEPQAGSSLGDVKTTAVPTGDGDYLITGTKCFISSGDHDLVPNILHPVLARLPGSPPGVKGISMFLVPKMRVNPDMSVGEWNDVTCVGLEHKLGLRGQATATLAFGENGKCRGTLLGKPNMGLAYMFALMNAARINTGTQAIGTASNAYQNALEYTKDRCQGRPLAEKDPASPQVPIIRHGDVRRMLLSQKAYTEGVWATLATLSFCIDRELTAKTPEEKEAANDMLELLTPVCKAYGSDAAYMSCMLSLQCYGGYGFSEEFPIAQMLRDLRVFPIYEGTNSIQGQDLLGRKVTIKKGAAFKAFIGEVTKVIKEASAVPALKDMTSKVEVALKTIVEITGHLAQLGKDPELYMSYATAYLRAFSEVVMGWQLLWQATIAQKALDAGSGEQAFYKGKLASAQHFINNDLQNVQTFAAIVKSGDRTALDTKEEFFC